MSCVWRGILEGLLLNKLVPPNMMIDKFVEHIKGNNKRVQCISWNDTIIKEKEAEENFQRIEEVSRINKGYDCSTSDPLLFLVCDLYQINIIHSFCGIKIYYRQTINEPKTTLCFASNAGHFWFDKKKYQNKKENKKDVKDVKDVVNVVNVVDAIKINIDSIEVDGNKSAKEKRDEMRAKNAKKMLIYAKKNRSR